MIIWQTPKIEADEFKIIVFDRDTCPSLDFNSIQLPPQNPGVIGIGFSMKRDCTYLRAAVEMRKNPSLNELQEAVSLLFEAFTNPESEKVKVVRGSTFLTGNEMQTTALIEYKKAFSL